MSATATRQTADERREQIIAAAFTAFADTGLVGTSTEVIADMAGISQPYLFRLFGTKKDLYIASVGRCYRDTLELFQRAAEGRRGEEALHAIGQAYMEQLETNRVWLRAQMQGYAASEDPDIRRVVREGFGDLVAYVRRVSGADWPVIWQFFATGMLLNVLSSMQVTDDPEPWMTDLLAGCGKEI
jgi:AcrR family transcriptional regulator